MRTIPPTASAHRGLALARELWRVVILVWLMPAFLLLPVAVGVWRSLSDSLGQLPETGLLPPGETLLVAAESLRGSGPVLAALLLTGLALTAAWVPLWHGGVVRWRTWAAGRPPRVGEVIGLGIGVWFRYLRLALAGGGGLVGLMLVVWVPLGAAAAAAGDELAEVRAVNLQLLALALSIVAVVLVVAATARAAWLLGEPGRRSAVVSWLAGFAGSVRHPLSSLGVAALWLVGGAVFAKGPLFLAMLLPALREGWLIGPVTAVGGLGAAVCWVALLGSYSPPPPETEKTKPAAAPPVAEPAPVEPETPPEPESSAPEALERDSSPRTADRKVSVFPEGAGGMLPRPPAEDATGPEGDEPEPPLVAEEEQAPDGSPEPHPPEA